MKRVWTAALMLLLASVSCLAADIEEIPFAPLQPSIVGQGGGAVATASGWGSFFANPAGFSREDGSITVVSLCDWLYARPDRALGLALSLVGIGTADVFDTLNAEITEGGFGEGASLGIGYTANGLGFGLALIADSYFWGPTLLGMSGDLTATIGFMGGLSYPFRVGGVTIHVGGQVRPMIRVHALLPNADAVDLFSRLQAGDPLFTALGSATAVYGVGIGLDLGVLVEFGWFTVGLAAKDIGGTAFNYSQDDFASLLASFQGDLALPPGSSVSDRYIIPMDVSFGVSLHPVLGSLKRWIDPSLYVEAQDIVGILAAALAGEASAWTMVHAGAQVRLVSFLSLWAGLDQGYLAFGGGLDLLFLEINLAVFTRELGRFIGDRPSSVVTLEIAVRF